MQVSWAGVFPAATTQFASDLSIDFSETQRVQDALVRDGVLKTEAAHVGDVELF